MAEPAKPPSVPGGPLLGCIADDVTGATDLALNLVQGGLRVVQWLESADVESLRRSEADAVVLALKSRSIDPEQAISISLAALRSLRAAGCARFYFKYCSTFDSTDRGNIGPVAEAMLGQLGGEQTIFCPAFPTAGRTVYAGHLFVGDRLLHESGMQDHPLNPMIDSCLPRVLERQVTGTVDLVHYRDVSRGPEAITARLQELAERDCSWVIVDTLDDTHLRAIAQACAGYPLLTGSSALARFLAAAYRDYGMVASSRNEPPLPNVPGRSAILSGSCSPATVAQVADHQKRGPARGVDIMKLMQEPEIEWQRIVDWISRKRADEVVLIYSTALPAQVADVQQRYGREAVAGAVEQLFARLSRTLVDDFSVRRLIVAGGETSAAVASALGVRALRIGPAIAPGVPWTESLSPRSLALAFKSGNFGGDDFFHTALEMLS